MERTYHVVRIIEDQKMTNHGKKLQLSNQPMNHDDACRFLKAQSKYSWARDQLEEA